MKAKLPGILSSLAMTSLPLCFAARRHRLRAATDSSYCAAVSGT
jgi:hypothetical protein